MEKNYTLTLSENACKNCYKCIRNCPVKAIYFTKYGTQISPSRCIACGNCFTVCPHKNKDLPSDLIKIKSFIDSNKKLIVSMDPSFVAYFQDKHKKVLTALRLLGIHYIEETTVAIDILQDYYKNVLSKTNNKYIISSTCATMNIFIQKYYPELIPYMITVLPPMMVHGKLLKEKYGDDSKVIYIGPCVATKIEYNDATQENTIIDGVLTFQELQDCIDKSEICLSELDDGTIDGEGSYIAKVFPLQGFSITEDDLDLGKSIIKVSGLDNIREILPSLVKGELDPCYVEVNYCSNGCINGPAFRNFDKGLFVRKKILQEYSDSSKERNIICDLDCNLKIDRSFTNKKVENAIPTELELRKILKEMGKFKESDELNCGTCGYDSCREKAIAVYNHMDKTDMCLPYMKHKSETVSNLIFEHSPNYIFLVNRSLKILSINPSAVRSLNIDEQYGDDLYLHPILNCIDYLEVFESKNSICGKRVRLEEHNLTVIQNLLYIEEQDTVLAILNDITKAEEKEKEVEEVKRILQRWYKR